MPPNKNICDCPNPPGGRVICEPHQLAICRVKDGVIEQSCIDPPEDLQGDQFSNWALSVITGIRRRPTASFTPADLRILNTGRYVNKDTGERVSFRLPPATGTDRTLTFAVG